MPQDQPVFINRDGGRFKYVLDWMRDGRVIIPMEVTKDALLNDLHYYGFDDADPLTIDDSAVFPTFACCITNMWKS